MLFIHTVSAHTGFARQAEPPRKDSVRVFGSLLSQECLEDKAVVCLLGGTPAFDFFLCNFNTFDVVF